MAGKVRIGRETSLPAVDVWDALRNALNAKEQDAVEEGYLPIAKWADRWGKSASITAVMVRRATAAGLMDKRDYRISVGTYIRSVPHYKYTGGDRDI